jgi:hypothetical protein
VNKENTFIKQVERTAKRDAYETAAMYIEQFGLEFGLKTIREKADSHSEYLDSLPLDYDYATQSLKPKGTVPDGRLVMQAMAGLAGTIKPTEERSESKGGGE